MFDSLLGQVDWSARGETPVGRVGQVRLLTAQSARRLAAHPTESEHPGKEINPFKSNNVCEKQPY
ncbi:hypothetical protein ABE41_004055 [Fictibacillus arsenicus]|uniref:Uncharacterized protein n=1 Tax=Fictibacillus arsenicus TaxID=255247 RepID=A0A1B1Z125_9BACL|nr:hypothetical protein ABE41_004055 [Fictibacillus arsenicus]